MKLQEIEIFDFKSIKHTKLKFLNNQLCFVGKNESGKSSIIQAVSYLNFLDQELNTKLTNKQSNRYPDGFPVISGVFKLSKQEYSTLLSIVTKYIEKPNGNLPNTSDKAFLQLKRWGNGISNISITITDFNNFSLVITNNINNKAKFINDFHIQLYPIIEYFENEDLLIEPATIDELISDERKFETFRRLLYLGGCEDCKKLKDNDINFTTTYLSNIEGKINRILKRHYKQDQSINITIRPAFDNKLNLIIKDKSGLSFSIDERSPGFRYYFSFLINKLYATKKNGKRNLILLLDEPGRGLHPKGSKDLLKTFDEIAQKSQILYTTHNPFLTIRNNIDALIFVEKQAENGTKINLKPSLNKYQILRKELGILLNDSFLIGDVNLVVEGMTEKYVFHRLFHIEKYSELEWLNIYNADGVQNIPQALNYLGKNNLDLSGIAILDSDQEARHIKTGKKAKGYTNTIDNKRWFSIEINDIFNNKTDRTFEDIFPQNLYIESFNKYCREYKDTFDTEYTDFVYDNEIKTPIIEKVEKHYKSFFNDERKKKTSITKHDVMRILLDKVDKMEKEEKEKALTNSYKLLDKIKSTFKKIEQNGSN